MNIDLKDLGNRIKDRRNELGLSQNEVYELTGISTGNLTGIENGKSAPSAKATIKLSEALHCSTDWILKGDSLILEKKELEEEIQQYECSKEIIGERIKSRRTELKYTQKYVEEHSRMSAGNLSCIESGKYLPSADSLIRLSITLKCSIDWILTGRSGKWDIDYLVDDHLISISKNDISQRIQQRIRISEYSSRLKKYSKSIDLTALENGEKVPTIKELLILSDCLNCSIDWILKGEQSTSVSNIDSQISDILNRVSIMNEYDKTEVYSIIKAIVDIKMNKYQDNAKC